VFDVSAVWQALIGFKLSIIDYDLLYPD